MKFENKLNTSSFPASQTSAMTSSVQGFIVGNFLFDFAETNLLLMNN